MGIDRSTYSYYESGRINPDIKIIMKLCKIFKVEYDDILDSKPNINDRLYDAGRYYVSEKDEDNLNNMYNLTKKEQELIIYYRLLSTEKKEELRNKIIKMCKNK